MQILKTTLMATMLGATLLTGCGGGNIETASSQDMAEMKPAKLADALTDKSLELVKVLNTVTDAPSAEAALPKVASLGETVRNANAAIKSLDPSLTSGNVDFMAKAGPMNMAQMEMMAEFQRIANIAPAAEVLGPEARKFGF